MFKKRVVDEYKVRDILYQFIKTVNPPCSMFITYNITRRGVVELTTNRPGILIGKQGIDIYRIKSHMKIKANAKDVKVYEHKQYVTNFGE
jgi:ribosomal protein S3